MITAHDVLVSKKNHDVFLCRNAIDNLVTWKEINSILNKAYLDNGVIFSSFATFNIDHSERYTGMYDELFGILKSIHPGTLHTAMTICHMLTGNDNKLNDPDAITARNNFLRLNKESVPFTFPDMTPSVHSDIIDGFFVQFNGQTKWKIYKNEIPDEYVLNTGDMLFIPKELNHSVESLCPRNAVSISFFDDEPF